jgi:serine/threonine-protein kinase RsbW
MSFRLPPATRSAPRARERLRTVMGAWADEETRCEAELLLTELVANGVRHARSTMEIHLTVEHNLLRVEVRDRSPVAPVPREADEHGGRGVLILDALASSWGVLGHPDAGKTVWFELADFSAPLPLRGASSSLEPGPCLLESN